MKAAEVDSTTDHEAVRPVPTGAAEQYDAVRWVFEARYGKFVALATVMLRDRAAAEDVVQDAFASTLRQGSKLRSTEDFGGYVAQAVVNGARGRLRKVTVEGREWPIVSVRARSDASNADFLDIVMQVPKRQAQCLVCRYLLDMSNGEIARTLGIKRATVKTHLRRGLSHLAELLEKEPSDG